MASGKCHSWDWSSGSEPADPILSFNKLQSCAQTPAWASPQLLMSEDPAAAWVSSSQGDPKVKCGLSTVQAQVGSR